MVLAGCGGSVDGEQDTGQAASGAASGASGSSGSGDPCAATAPSVTNLRALELITCTGEVPAAARLFSFKSSGGGMLDAEGKDTEWFTDFVDEAAGLKFDVRVANGVVTVKVHPSDTECQGKTLTMLDSATIVPDAVQRLTAVDPVEGGYTNYFFDEGTGCEFDAPEEHAVGVYRLSQDQAVSLAWYLHYRPDGTFDRMCGPCEDPFSCTC
jgi:hypothetical protein